MSQKPVSPPHVLKSFCHKTRPSEPICDNQPDEFHKKPSGCFSVTKIKGKTAIFNEIALFLSQEKIIRLSCDSILSQEDQTVHICETKLLFCHWSMSIHSFCDNEEFQRIISHYDVTGSNWTPGQNPRKSRPLKKGIQVEKADLGRSILCLA